MSKRKKQLTQEQIDWRNSILRGKVKPIIKSEKMLDVIVTIDDKINNNVYYLNNGIFWINEYLEGRADKKRLLHTAKAMQENAKELEKLLMQYSSQRPVYAVCGGIWKDKVELPTQLNDAKS